MNPGKELDILVALKVMGWERHPDFSHLYRDTNRKEHGAFQVAEHIPNYSTDIAAAWDVFEKLAIAPDAGPLAIERYRKSWAVTNGGGYEDGETFSEGDTAPHAICLAALKAVGVEI